MVLSLYAILGRKLYDENDKVYTTISDWTVQVADLDSTLHLRYDPLLSQSCRKQHKMDDPSNVSHEGRSTLRHNLAHTNSDGQVESS